MLWCNVFCIYVELFYIPITSLHFIPVVKIMASYTSVYITGDFLTEAGWFSHAEQAYTTALTLIQRCSDEESIKKALDCCGK